MVGQAARQLEFACACQPVLPAAASALKNKKNAGAGTHTHTHTSYTYTRPLRERQRRPTTPRFTLTYPRTQRSERSEPPTACTGVPCTVCTVHGGTGRSRACACYQHRSMGALWLGTWVPLVHIGQAPFEEQRGEQSTVLVITACHSPQSPGAACANDAPLLPSSL